MGTAFDTSPVLSSGSIPGPLAACAALKMALGSSPRAARWVWVAWERDQND